jgi:hypothetical protein
MKRRRISGCRAQLSARTLMATGASRRSSCASQTVAKLPVPSIRSTL